MYFFVPMSGSHILNIPNCIDFFRLALLFAAITRSGKHFVLIYTLSVVLDYFDGMAARYFDQVTALGSCLDMFIDRVSTMVICFKISSENPKYSKKCTFYSMIDIMSHFIFFIAANQAGSNHKSYSDMLLMQIYYNPIVLKCMCIGSEMYFLAVYIFKKYDTKILFLETIAFVKTFFHVVHFYMGLQAINNADKKL